jgi:hypothetical protein
VLVKCLRRYPEERYLSVADLAAALIPFARKSSLVSAEATIRIVQGSSLAHGPLPRAMDLPPPGLDSTKVPAGGATSFGSTARTVNVSGPPPATQTQLAAISATLQLARRGNNVAAAVSAEPAAVSSPPPAPSPSLPQLAAEPASPTPSSPAPLATPVAATRPPGPASKPRPPNVAKPRPQPTSADESEKLLNHR